MRKPASTTGDEQAALAPEPAAAAHGLTPAPRATKLLPDMYQEGPRILPRAKRELGLRPVEDAQVGAVTLGRPRERKARQTAAESLRAPARAHRPWLPGVCPDGPELARR